MKQYRCLKTFYIPLLDDEGFPSEKNMCVKKDSIWCEAPYPILGGDIRLESDNDNSYLEIDEKYLKCYFEYIDEVKENV